MSPPGGHDQALSAEAAAPHRRPQSAALAHPFGRPLRRGRRLRGLLVAKRISAMCVTAAASPAMSALLPVRTNLFQL